MMEPDTRPRPEDSVEVMEIEVLLSRNKSPITYRLYRNAELAAQSKKMLHLIKV